MLEFIIGVLLVIFLLFTTTLKAEPQQIQFYNQECTNQNISKITDDLYLTDYNNARDYESLKNLGVKQILIIGEELPRHGEMYFKVLHIKIKDIPSENIKKHFNAAFQFIKNNKTVVHCAAGISRSATLVASYLMRKEGLGVKEALKKVKQARRCINPNPGFVQQLIDFEQELKRQPSEEEQPTSE
jgi:predicted protein tyrosine phosphatase